ncbi:ROK family protein [Thalassotalea montiporae]
MKPAVNAAVTTAARSQSSLAQSSSAQSSPAQYCYGLDIGGTKIEIAVFDNQLNLVDSWRTPTPTDNYQAFIATVAGLVQQAEQKFGATNTIGIGMPGIIDSQGRVKSANIPCATGQQLAQDLQQALAQPIHIANDCHLFALSEANGGAGDGKMNVYGAIIGTGAAGGFCINGQLAKSRQNIIGEYGHIAASASVINQYQLPINACGCGLKGCYETYIAGPGLAKLYQHFGADQADTKVFVEQLKAGDPVAKQTFDCYMDLLGAAFASLVLSYDPDVIVVGGGLSKITAIIEALPAAIAKHLFAGVEVPPVQAAKFGDSSGVRGAAILGTQLTKNDVNGERL